MVPVGSPIPVGRLAPALPQSRPMDHRPIVYGHRGAPAHARENTVEAFVLAIEHGADGVELDVRRSRDGALVVHHQDRPALGSAPFVTQDLRTIKAAVPWVPTLDEAWQAIGSGALLNIEIKNDPTQADFDPARQIAADVVDWIRANAARERVVVSSFDGAALAAIRIRAPEIVTGLLVTAAVDPFEAIGWAIRDGHHSLHLPAPVVLDDPAKIVTTARPLDVLVWTVNDPATALLLADAGVDGIFSDDPGLMVATFSRR